MQEKKEIKKTDELSQLKNYAAKQLKIGKTKDEIKKALHAVGWKKEIIEKSFAQDNFQRKKDEIDIKLDEKLKRLNKTITEIEKKKSSK